MRTGSAQQSDLFRAIWSCKINSKLAFNYVHVKGHQDRYLLWHQLSLEAQLNVKCDCLAKAAMRHWMVNGADTAHGLQLLPREKAAVFINVMKLTTDVYIKLKFYSRLSNMGIE